MKHTNRQATSYRILDAAVATADIADSAVTTAKVADANVTTAKVLDANVTIPKLESSLLEDVKVVRCSFEAAEVGALKFYFPMKVTINKLRSVVVKALGATDTGTITAANATGAMSGGVITVAISAAVGEEDTATPTTNNVIAADSYIQLTSAKTTAGGVLEVSIEYTYTA